MIKQIYLLFFIFILYGVGPSSNWAAAMTDGSELEMIDVSAIAPAIILPSSPLWCQTRSEHGKVYVKYSHPAENDCLDEEERNRLKKRTVLRWLACVECTPAHLDNVVGWGNEALDLLKKAYEGDEELLGIDRAYKRALHMKIDAMKRYFTEPVDKDDLVALEIKRKLRVARLRAAYALKAIGTREALDIL